LSPTLIQIKHKIAAEPVRAPTPQTDGWAPSDFCDRVGGVLPVAMTAYGRVSGCLPAVSSTNCQEGDPQSRQAVHFRLVYKGYWEPANFSGPLTVGSDGRSFGFMASTS